MRLDPFGFRLGGDLVAKLGGEPQYEKQQVGAFSYSDLLFSSLERATGVEPASSAWKAEVLPMNYAREYGRDDRI